MTYSAFGQDGTNGRSQGEVWAEKELQNGKSIDLVKYCGTSVEAVDCRKISAGLLLHALTGNGDIASNSINITGAIIEEKVDISNFFISRRVRLIGCRFEGDFIAAGAHFTHDLVFDSTSFLRGLNADNLHVDGQLFLRNNVVVLGGDFNLTDASLMSGMTVADSIFETKFVVRRASIASKLLVQTSRFNQGIDADFVEISGSFDLGPNVVMHNRYASFKAATIGGRWDIIKCQFDHGFYAADASVNEDLSILDTSLSGSNINISGLQVHNDLRFRDVRISQQVDVRLAKIGGSIILAGDTTLQKNIDVNDSVLGQNLEIRSKSLENGISANRIRVGGSVIFDNNSIVGPSSFTDAVIAVDLYLSNITLVGVDLEKFEADPGVAHKDSFSAKGMRVAGTIYCNNLRERFGPVDFLEVRVAGNIEVSNSDFDSSLYITLSHIEQSIFIHNNTFTKKLVINGGTIGQHLDISGNVFNEDVDLGRSIVGGDLRIVPNKDQPKNKWPTFFDEKSILSLRLTQVGIVQDELSRQNGINPWPKKIDLQGFSYNTFGDARDVRWAKDWLSRQVHQDKGTPTNQHLLLQPYKTLAAYFKSIGDDESSDEILHEARDQERAEYWGDCSLWSAHSANACIQSAGLLILDAGIHYGVGPWQIRTLLWVLFFTATGVFVLRWSHYARQKSPWWRLGASLNRFIPVLELRKEFTEFYEKSSHLRPWQMFYFPVHAIVGFMLASFILAALAGLTQAH